MSETDFLLKLFDTLKDASKETQQLCHALLTNQNDIGNLLKNIPVKELKDTLKEHSKESSADIKACTEIIELKNDGVLDRLKTVETKIAKMILVVIVAVGLFSAALLIGSLVRDKDDSINSEIITEIQKKRKRITELEKRIEILKSSGGAVY